MQHMIKSMDTQTGRMAVVLPHGALFRSGVEAKMRQNILEMDVLDAVINFTNLFYGATLAAAILVFRNKKQSNEKTRFL